MFLYPSEFLFKYYLKDRYESFWKSSDLKYNINGRKLNRYFHVFGIPISFLLFALFLFWTSFADNKSVEVRKPGSLIPKIYSFNEVTKIVHAKKLVAPNGNIVYRSNFSIVFNDNWVWNIDDEFDGETFIKSMTQKTGLPIIEESN